MIAILRRYVLGNVQNIGTLSKSLEEASCKFLLKSRLSRSGSTGFTASYSVGSDENWYTRSLSTVAPGRAVCRSQSQ